MKLIAVSGWKQNGKDTLADYLIANHEAKRVSFADPLKDLAAAEYEVAREAFDKPELKEQPLLHLPVDPQDGFSRNLCEFMFKEFRNDKGHQASKFSYVDGKFVGTVYYKEGKPIQIDPLNWTMDIAVDRSVLYWTPRALAILKGSSNRAVRSDFWVAQAISLAKAKGGLVVISDLRYKSELKQMRDAFGSDMVTLRIQRYDTSPSTDPSERDLDDAKFDFHVENRGTLADLYAKIEEILKA